MKIKEIRDAMQKAKEQDPKGYQMVVDVLDAGIKKTPELTAKYDQREVLALQVLFRKFEKEEGGYEFLKEVLTKESVITQEINKQAVDLLWVEEEEDEN